MKKQQNKGKGVGVQGKQHAVRRGLAEAAIKLAEVEAAAHAERLRVEAELRAAGGKVKGTRDMTDAAKESGLEIRIEVLLRAAAKPMTMIEIVAALRQPAGKVHEVVSRLAKTPCPTRSVEHAPDTMTIYNHGSAEDPRWAWVLGDAVSAPELTAEIEAMLRRRPYTFAELTAATGARRGRISGATVEFARRRGTGGDAIWSVGGGARRYRWFIGELSQLSEKDRKSAKRVRLAPDKNKV